MAEQEQQEQQTQDQETENEALEQNVIDDPALNPNAYDDDLALLNEQAGGQDQQENIENEEQTEEANTQEEETGEEEGEDVSFTGDQKVDNVLLQISKDPVQFAKNHLELRKHDTQISQKLSGFSKGGEQQIEGQQFDEQEGQSEEIDFPEEVNPFADLKPGPFSFSDFQKKYGRQDFIENNQEFVQDMEQAVRSMVTEQLISAGQRIQTAGKINRNTQMIKQKYPQHLKHYSSFISEMRNAPDKIVTLDDMFAIYLKKMGLISGEQQKNNGNGQQSPKQKLARFGKKGIGSIVNSPSARTRVAPRSTYGDKNFDSAFGD